MEKWRRVWREGIRPQLTEAMLRKLRTALENDDSRLVQGKTTVPEPL